MKQTADSIDVGKKDTQRKWENKRETARDSEQERYLYALPGDSE